MKTSPLTLQEWQNLENLARNAQDALSALSHALAMSAMAHSEDQTLAETLLAEANRVDPVQTCFRGSYWFHCQSEWTGGDSHDPKNHVLREPHVMGSRRLTVINRALESEGIAPTVEGSR